jgi:hypothetical protein
MLGKIKEYVIKKLFLLTLGNQAITGGRCFRASKNKKSLISLYLTTRHPLERNKGLTNQSRESPTKSTMKHFYSAIPVGRLDWSRESRQTLR